MTITDWQVDRLRDETTRFRVTSDLVPTQLREYVRYHWYADGRYVGVTAEGELRLTITGPGNQLSVECIDTLDESFDPIANAPRGFPATRRVYFRRSLSAKVNKYQILLRRGTELTESVGEVEHDDKQWRYFWTTPRLEDLKTHEVSVRAIDDDGDAGSASVPFVEFVVRVPDAPNYDIAFASGTGRVTFSEV